MNFVEMIDLGLFFKKQNKNSGLKLLIKFIFRVESGDPEPSLSYPAIGLGCWMLPMMQ